MNILMKICIIGVLFALVCGVDRSNFKTCDQSSFCRRHRALKPSSLSPYTLLPNTVVISESSISAEVINEKTRASFILELYALVDSTLRLKINEKAPLYPRFEEPFALNGEPKLSKFEIKDRTAEGFLLVSGDAKADVHSKPLRINFYYGDDLCITFNADGLLKFEHYRQRRVDNEEQEKEGENVENSLSHADEDDTNGLWEEVFKSHTDSKPRGPASIGADIAFVNSKNVYGIPMHADSFSLKETTSSDPYRLYNLDVFEYELYNPMALYGSVPVLLSHSAEQTVGIFWHNAAETWIDIKKSPTSDVVSSITGFFSGGDKETPQVRTHWFSESGIIDLFIMLGPRPMDVFRQYGKLTGNTNLPPLFSLGYHQSRWNYNDEEDVRHVHENFDHHNFPLDVIWLDIEHADGKRYFTWDELKFPNPVEMTAELVAKGRKLVTIVDPHIKKDSNYFFYRENRDNGYFLKNSGGSEYDGWCWPGSSAYIDFTMPEAREHFINTYSLDRYKGSTLDTFTWNDMNEPSVFNGPEVTMQKDIVHEGIQVEHRDLHNVYGMIVHSCTYEGQLRRSGGKLRPFVLTRAHYAGTQRTSALWTGDNTAEWDHLKISVPMLLSLSVAGITHVGADIGGFFGNPSEFLLSRWYQAAAYQPFMRTHSHLDTRRREPWLYDDETQNIIREAIRDRYKLLPLWYTLFYENELTGAPPMRPLWVEFPADVHLFDIDDEYLIGSQLLVRPVAEELASQCQVYFPQALWYDIKDYSVYNGPTTLTVESPRNKIPVYQRGGTIVPRKERVRRASSLMSDDPYTLVVTLDDNGKAQGTLYIDDEHTFEYRKGQFLYLGFSFEKNVLSSKILDPSGSFKTKSWLERVIVLGLNFNPSQVILEGKDIGDGKKVLEHTFTPRSERKSSVLVIRKPAVSMQYEFALTLN